jgi:hypothetical protein
MVLIALGGLGAVIALALTGAGVTMRRIPLTGWLAVPMLVLALGAFASWTSSVTVLNNATAAGAGLAGAAASGLAKAWAPDYLSRWVAALVLLLSAWGAAAGAMRVGKYALWTAFSGIMTMLVSLVFAVLVAVMAQRSGLEGGVYFISLVLLLGGVGVGLAAMRRAFHEHAFRVAGMRFTAAVLFFIAVLQAVRGLILGVRMDIYQTQATVAPEALEEVVTAQLAYLNDVNSLGWMAVAGAFIAAVCAVLAELGEVVQRYTIWDTFGAAILLVLVVGVRVVEFTGTDATRQIALLQPMPALVAEFGYDLPPGSVALKGEFRDSHFARAGFGDALVYQDGAWVRKYAWTGRGWRPDDTPIDEALLHKGLQTLVAIESAEGAKPLLEVLERLGGEAFLLLRAGELDINMPPEAAHLQGTLLPIKLSTERDLEKELWVDGDKYDLYYGPIRDYGEGSDAKDVTKRFQAAYDRHEGVSSVHIAVGNRTRVSHVAELCVSAVVYPEEVEAPTEEDPEAMEVALHHRDGWCAITGDEASMFLDTAVEAVLLDQPSNVRMEIRSERVEPGSEEVLARELPAFGWCQEMAKAELAANPPPVVEGEEPLDPALVGEFMVEFEIDDRGRAGEYVWSVDNMDSRILEKCVRGRIDRTRFPKKEELPAEEGAPPPTEEEEEPPAKMLLVLNYL